MAEKIRLGIIGISEGNGHPYSWSAIFNGYDPLVMKECPFPVIPQYLSKQRFPQDSLNQIGEVTHIWTQDHKFSNHIAKASNIDTVVEDPEEMSGQIDALLLARDDAENHYQMALPFLKKGIPVFIDKPLALSIQEANKILDAQLYPDQIFSCSSLRYASELNLSGEDKERIGDIKMVEASIPKSWDTYAVHLIESLVSNLPNRGKLNQITPFMKDQIHLCVVEWDNVTAFLKVTGTIPCPLRIAYLGETGSVQKVFSDSFSCFKRSLETFIQVIHREQFNIDRKETLEIISIVEGGRI